MEDKKPDFTQVSSRTKYGLRVGQFLFLFFIYELFSPPTSAAKGPQLSWPQKGDVIAYVHVLVCTHARKPPIRVQFDIRARALLHVVLFCGIRRSVLHCRNNKNSAETHNNNECFSKQNSFEANPKKRKLIFKS